MKKNKVSIDFISFGDLESETRSKLEDFHKNVEGGDGSHLEFIPPGPNLLSDNLITTPIVNSGDGPSMGGAGGAGAEGGENSFEFGIDPSVDPELAMALRMSMEEETNRLSRQRREEEEKTKAEQDKNKLEGIPEGSEEQPLLDESGEPSSGEPSSGEQKKEDKKDDDPDKMDTA